MFWSNSSRLLICCRLFCPVGRCTRYNNLSMFLFVCLYVPLPIWMKLADVAILLVVDLVIMPIYSLCVHVLCMYNLFLWDSRHLNALINKIIAFVLIIISLSLSIYIYIYIYINLPFLSAYISLCVCRRVCVKIHNTTTKNFLDPQCAFCNRNKTPQNKLTSLANNML